MRTNIKRNTGREVTKCSFQIDVRDIDVVEKISKKRMISQSGGIEGECIKLH